MNRSWLAALIVLLALLVWMLSGMFSAGDDTQTIAETDDEQKLQRVEVTVVEPVSITRNLELYGELEATRSAAIRAETSGQVQSVVISEGQRVKAEQLLVEIDGGTRDGQLAEAKARVKSAESEFEAASSLQRQGLQSQVQMEQISASLEAARAQLASIERDIANTRIVAPFDGIVSQVDVTEGELLSVGGLVLHLIDDSSFDVVAEAPQLAMADLHTEQGVVAKLINNVEIPGTLTYISPVADPQTRTFKIKAHLDSVDAMVAAGLSTELYIPLEELPAVYLSPSALSLDDAGLPGVKVVDAQDTVKFVPIDIINTDVDGAWVSGLNAGDRLITLGQGFVQEGMQVEPVPASAAE